MCRPSVILTTLLGVLIGIVNALAWYFGFINSVRIMIPYALAFVILLFITTAILKAKCGNIRCVEEKCLDAERYNKTCNNVNCYANLIILVAAIFIVFAIIVLATSFPFDINAILAFIGCIAFWIMLISFVLMIINICQRQHCSKC